MNISSIVVNVRSEYFDEVLRELKHSDLCEVHFHDPKGKIVVTIEGDDLENEMDKMKAIQEIEHVASASFVYSTSAGE